MSIVTVLILAIYVLPKFEAFFADLDAELPLPTRMLLGFTDFLGHWWWAICRRAGGAGACSSSAITRTTRGKYARDALLLKVPVLGETIQYALVERFCRVLASMVERRRRT